MMTAAVSHRVAYPFLPNAQGRTSANTYAVRLIDRRTGQGHRVNGSPLVIFTKDPDAAVLDLMEGRDARVWDARVEPIEARS